MRVYRDLVLVELDEKETERYKTDEGFKADIESIAEELLDETGRAAEIYSVSGELLDTVSPAAPGGQPGREEAASR